MAGGPPSFTSAPPLFPKEITKLSFFFDNFKTSDEAADFVIRNSRGRGTFLLRPSTRCHGMLTLTISIDQELARHVNVQQKPDERSETGVSFFIIPERSFSSFHDLYAYYSVNAICNLEMVNNVRLLNPLVRDSVSPAPLPAPGPAVMSDEIPPLPRKWSVSSGIGTGSNQTVEDGRRLSNSSQPGLPELPPMRRDRPSLDSQGNDNVAGSGSSGGSGPSGGRHSFGAATGQDQVGFQYLAPGSPGFDSFSALPGTLSPQPSAFYRDNQPTLSDSRNTLSKKELKKLEQEEKRKQKEEKKKKKGKHTERMEQLGWCRPPMPTPTPMSTAQAYDEPPYYSSPRPYKNHLEELKKMLRESEICDCGLRMLDAELVEGWTVHRSRENVTFKRVFYQHEDGNTTWAFPTSIGDLLSDQQVEFIVRLCKEADQELPVCVMERYQSLKQAGRGGRPLNSTSSFNSTRSRSDSSSSEVSLNRSSALDQRPRMPNPEGL